jgi:hypothetical protein
MSALEAMSACDKALRNWFMGTAMLRLRICAFLLVILTLATAVWAWLEHDALKLGIASLFAAACLAMVVPFDATELRRRWRVLLGCLVYVAAMAVATFLAYKDDISGLISGALVLLVLAGIGLTLWALATRKRRRTPSYRRYYDN